MAANVMCHIPYMHSVMAGIGRLLKPNGVLMFEDPYLGDIVEKTSYDQIYDEHAFYFSVALGDRAVRPARAGNHRRPAAAGARRFDALRRRARRARGPPRAAVPAQREKEARSGLGTSRDLRAVRSQRRTLARCADVAAA